TLARECRRAATGVDTQGQNTRQRPVEFKVLEHGEIRGAGHELDGISFSGIIGLRFGCKAAGQWHAPSLAVPWDAHIVKQGNSARLASFRPGRGVVARASGASGAQYSNCPAAGAAAGPGSRMVIAARTPSEAG